MIKITQEMMRDLSFPDEGVEKMEFYLENKNLKIFVQGAWMDVNEGYYLDKGVVVFNDWEAILIKKDHAQVIEGLPEGLLNDLCEAIFSDSIVFLAGYGPHGWIEWMIIKPKMYAEFEESQEGKG